MLKRLSLILLTFLLVGWAKSQVNAGFTANQTSGCPNPFLLILSDNSTAPGAINSWSWQLTGPAGFTTQTSNTNQLSTTLTIPGFYSVSLTVCSGGVCDTETQTNFIQVFAPPTVNMNISPLVGCPPFEVCFDGTFTAGCGTITNSVIDVRDGTVYSNMEDVCHTYSNSGNYTNFTVSVTNSCGCITTETFTDIVSVSPAPTANFTSSNPFSCTAPFTVNFNNTSTNTSGGTTYEWNIPPVVNGAMTQNLSQSFNPGTYDVELIVTNPNGCTDTMFQPGYVIIGNPVADFSSDFTSVCPGTNVSFFDSSSGGPTSWMWYFEGHGTSSSQNPTVNFNTIGSWDVSLVTSYPGGCTDSVYFPNYITVNQPPVNNFTVTDSGACQVPFTTTFNSTSTNAASTTWSFPGGTPSSFTGSGPVTVTYNTMGTYAVTMTSTSNDSCVTTTNFPGVIQLVPLTATIVVDSSNGCAPVTSSFGFNLSSGEVAASQSWTLTGSDIGTSTASNPLATYNAVGCYDASVIVTTVSGCTTTATLTNAVCAGTPPTGGFNIAPTTICFEQEDVFATYTGSGADTIFWDFGDPAPPQWAADDVTVSHMYSDDIGTFTVTMIPYQYGCPGDTTIYVDTVEVLGPIAQFSGLFDGCATWNTFNFTDESVESDSVFWDFGDPSTTLDTSSSTNPSWTYPAIDTVVTYSVTQYAYNFTTGCEHQNTNTIQVYPPNADFSFTDSVGCAPTNITFTNTSFNFNPAPNSTNWNWVNTYQFSGAGQFTIWNRGSTRLRTYTDPGVYTVIMRSQDLRGCWDTIVRNNLITIHGITAGFTQDTTIGCVPLTVNFTDTSVAPITYVAAWHWDFGVPGVLTDTSNLQNPSFTYTAPGIYTITLTATDSFGCTSVATSSVEVNGPTASFTLSDTFFCTNQNIGIVNNSTGDALSYNWIFTNGTPGTSTVQNPPALSYATEGFQDIFLEVMDIHGCFDDTTVTLPVFDVVAEATASLDTILCFANVTPITFNNTSYNNVDSSSVFWDLGNGTTSTLYNPSAVYNLAGNYVVTMSISSNSGCSDTTVVDTIFVGGPYAEIAVLDRDTACICEEITFEILTWNAANPSFISGDGGIISYVPNGIIGDTIIDTITYQYCQVGDFIPQVFIDDGTCSGNIELNDTIFIDSLVVDFVVQPFSLCDSGQVCFTDSSYNLVNDTVGLTSWFWDFGDGNTSTSQDACNFYNSPGLYDVSLVVTNVFGCIDTLSQQVFIPESPVVQFAPSDSSGCVGINVDFFDSTFVHPSNQIESWFWDFGVPSLLDDTSDLQNPSYSYLNTGIFTVVLSVTDTFGCSGMDSIEIEVFDLPLVQTIADTNLCLGDSILVTSTGALNYSWTPNYNISDTSVSNPIIYPQIDTTYFLQAIDTNGCTNYDTLSIDVTTLQANFSVDTVCFGETSIFTDLSTSDVTITNWSWNFDDPGSGANDSSNLQNPTHDYTMSNTYNVSLSIVDTFQCTSDTIIQAIVQDAPIASFTADSVCFGSQHTFNSSTSFGGGGAIVSYHWDFGVSGTTTDTSNLPNTVFTYNAPGLYTVCLTITTDQQCAGNFDDTCFVVQAYELPNVAFTVDSACMGNANTFSDLSSAGADAGIAGATWNFGQNPGDSALSFVTPFNTQFTYDTTGLYNVSLTVVDSNLCVNSASQTAQVFENPDADFTFGSSCQNQSNEFVSLPVQGNSSNLTYYWNFDEGLGYQLGDSVQDYAFVITGNHDVAHVVVDALGCSDTVTQVINVLAAPSAVITGDNTVCGGFSTQLTGASSVVSAPPATYNWSVTASQTSTITYSPNSDTEVFLVVVDANGCSDSTSILIDYLQRPEADFDWSDACEDIQFTLNSLATEGDAFITSYTWEITSPISGSNTFFTPNVNYLVPTADTLRVNLIVEDANGCIDSLPQTVIVDQQVDVLVLTPEFLICPNDSVLLNLADTTQFLVSGVGSVLWTPSIGVSDINGDSIILSPPSSNTYTLTAFSTLNQCPPDDDNIINIEVAPNPVITVEATPNPVLSGAVSNITTGVVPFNVNTDTLLWDNSSGTLNTDFGFNIEATPIVETLYPFQLIYYYDTLRCVEDSSILIQVITECDNEIIYVPNIFTPNDDSRNDEFRVTGYGIEVINYLRVFDRWGQLMYEGTNLEVTNGRMNAGEGWKGDNQGGMKCNSGVYVYAYELICSNGDVIRGKGNVTLIK